MNQRGITKVEIGVIIAIVATLIGGTIIVNRAVKELQPALEHVKKEGLKSVVKDVWNGEQ